MHLHLSITVHSTENIKLIRSDSRYLIVICPYNASKPKSSFYIHSKTDDIRDENFAFFSFFFFFFFFFFALFFFFGGGGVHHGCINFELN